MTCEGIQEQDGWTLMYSAHNADSVKLPFHFSDPVYSVGDEVKCIRNEESGALEIWHRRR